MLTTSGIAMAVAAAAAFATVACGSAAASPRAGQPPHAVTGPVISGGADGTPHLLQCPPGEWAYGGGFDISPAPGGSLDPVPADVLENRPNDNGSAWIVTVRKNDCPDGTGRVRPADLTVHVVCTEGQDGPHGG
ncbi:hypothetical protein [Kitasatospora sp. NPDC057198]|uniref:hypothetical protein n=1 Tax=Kitasatospora sp. NPDC057198 TaxID=3346046 RepID=UPI0036273FCC